MFSIVLPIFALIFAGFVCRKRELLGPTAAAELNRFVVWLALPALLFDIMAKARWHRLYQPDFVATFTIACLAVFLGVLAHRLMSGRHLTDASIDAIAAAYPNTGYLGFPLCLLLFGNDSLMPTTLATIVVACVLFALAIVLIEIGLQAQLGALQLTTKVVRALAKNPLIMAPIAGAVLAATGLTLPNGVETFLKLLGNAASPCALVSLGLFLAEKRDLHTAEAAHRQQRIPVALTLMKLIAQPALTWWLATDVFTVPAGSREVAILLAALPTGTGPYMLAEFYEREALITSRTILYSTTASLLTLSIILILMGVRR